MKRFPVLKAFLDCFKEIQAKDPPSAPYREVHLSTILKHAILPIAYILKWLQAQEHCTT